MAMTFDELTPGARFTIDGAQYEAKTIGGRVVIAYPLPNGKRCPDPDDLTGYEFVTDFFSDLRFNRNNATPAQCEDYLTMLTLL